MRALQFTEFGPVSNLRLIELPEPQADSVTAIVKVAAGAISPSDVKNVEGKMEHTTLPRVPGRDYAGTVVGGPPEWMAPRSGEPAENRLFDRRQPCRISRRPGCKLASQATDPPPRAGRCHWVSLISP